MNAEILEAKRVRRRYERRWRKSSLTVHRQAFKTSCEDVKKKIRESKSTYFIKQIDACGKDQRKLFKIVNNLLGRGKPSSLPEYTTPIALAETFHEFFTTKISKIRTLLTDMEASTDELRCPPISSLLKSSPAQLCSFNLLQFRKSPRSSKNRQQHLVPLIQFLLAFFMMSSLC